MYVWYRTGDAIETIHMPATLQPNKSMQIQRPPAATLVSTTSNKRTSLYFYFTNAFSCERIAWGWLVFHARICKPCTYFFALSASARGGGWTSAGMQIVGEKNPHERGVGSPSE